MDADPTKPERPPTPPRESDTATIGNALPETLREDASTGDGRLASKAVVRRSALLARRVQPDKERVSKQIIDRVMKQPQYSNAGCVLWYVDVRDEVRTRHALPGAIGRAIANDQRIVIPYCDDQDLRLFELRSMDELESGRFGILEPKPELRLLDHRSVAIQDVDLVLVPGVAFDGSGGRIGHGKGFYDRCLRDAKPETCLMAIAFACQVFDRVPTERHDIMMDVMVTEHGVTDTNSVPEKEVTDTNDSNRSTA